ncbi:MAG: heterodisulfide reductase subunit C [Deltaproteobacteria bacterium]|nr:heterodisulfide reductase subunit C [Deltaproteobacteria bacterium]
MGHLISGRRSVPAFRTEVEARAGCGVLACFQCGKCGAGCPLQEHLDYSPSQIIHLIRLGQEETVLASKAIWLCASCETCTTRCPQGVDIARVMDAARSLAFDRRVPSAVPSVPSFYKATRANLMKFGRMFEVWLLASLKLRTGDITKDMDLGRKMMAKRKLNLFPTWNRVWETRAIFKRVARIEKERAAERAADTQSGSGSAGGAAASPREGGPGNASGGGNS